MRRIYREVLVSLLLLLNGCAIQAVDLSNMGRRVLVFSGEQNPSCKSFQEYEAISDQEGFLSSFESARNEAMNEAADQGGNAVRIQSSAWRGTEVSLLAEFYKCSSKSGMVADKEVLRPKYGSRFLPDNSFQERVYEKKRQQELTRMKAIERMSAGIAGSPYDPDGKAQSKPQLDFTCFNDCQKAGYQYELCEKKCSY